MTAQNTLTPNSLHKEDFFPQERQRTRNKIQRQETEDRGDEKKSKEIGEGVYTHERQSLPLDREKTYIGDWQLIKEKKEKKTR